MDCALHAIVEKSPNGMPSITTSLFLRNTGIAEVCPICSSAPSVRWEILGRELRWLASILVYSTSSNYDQ